MVLSFVVPSIMIIVMKLKDPTRVRPIPVSFRLTEDAYRKLKVLAIVYKRAMSSLIEEMVDKASHSAIKSFPDEFKEAQDEIMKPESKKAKKAR